MNGHRKQMKEVENSINFLMSVHDKAPGLTENILNFAKAEDGRSSYEILCDMAGPLLNKTVVVLACGSGRLTELSAERTGTSGQVFGIDLNGSELTLAKNRLCRYKHVRFLQESACEISLPSASADVVLSHMAFMLFQPIEQAITEIARTLRSGGKLAALVPSLNGGNAQFNSIRSCISAVMAQDVPENKKFPLGDSSAGSVAGIKKLLSDNGCFSNKFNVMNIDIIFRETPGRLISLLLPLFYYTYLLSEKGKADLQKKWLAILEHEAKDCNGSVKFSLPLSVFTVIRH